MAKTSKKTEEKQLSLKERLLAASTLEYTDSLDDSKIYNEKDEVATPIPALNIAYSARIDGGITPGLTVWAGPSKHFKTLFCLITAASYLKKYSDAICLFYDSEFGSPKEYFRAAGIDPSRVVHSPVTSLEELREDLTNQLHGIKRGDRVVIVLDSLGNLASKKETEDALKGSEAADMTRAKVVKSMFRIATPHLRLKDIPMLVVAHTYQTMETYSKKVVGSGTGVYYSADNIYIVGRQQEKEGTGAKAELVGFDFIINVEKSRYVREKAKIPLTVLREGGVMKWSGLFDLALEGDFVGKHNASTYGIFDQTTGELLENKYDRSDLENNGVFWKQIFNTTKFADWIKNHFTVSSGDLISEEVNIDAEEVQADE